MGRGRGAGVWTRARPSRLDAASAALATRGSGAKGGRVQAGVSGGCHARAHPIPPDPVAVAHARTLSAGAAATGVRTDKPPTMSELESQPPTPRAPLPKPCPLLGACRPDMPTQSDGSGMRAGTGSWWARRWAKPGSRTTGLSFHMPSTGRAQQGSRHFHQHMHMHTPLHPDQPSSNSMRSGTRSRLAQPQPQRPPQ